MEVKKSYKFRLKLSESQTQQCEQFSGSCRYVWNRSLALKKEQWEKAKEKVFCYSLNNFLVNWKEELPWLKKVPSQALQQVNKNLDQAYKNLYNNHACYPTFKKKGKKDSFRLPQGIKLLPDLNHKTGVVKLPKLGTVRFVKTQTIQGTIKHVTISKCSNHWYIAFNCSAVPISFPASCSSTPAIGIDRGIAIFGQCSNGKKLVAPKPLTKTLKKLRKIQRILSRKKRFSENWKKQKEKLIDYHHHIANIRHDFLHKSTTQLAKNHGRIVLEDLKTKNMTKSAKGTLDKPGKNVKAKSGLNRSILDQGWYKFKQLLEYKTQWYGSRLILVTPHYTSQTCSNCGHIDAKSRISQSNFGCTLCAHTENADLNAAKNILAAGLAVTACGDNSLEFPMKQEPAIRNATALAGA